MPESRSWSWRHALIKSDLPPTTRHVLLTISCFMNEVGGGCYPTQEQIAEATGLTDRAVRKHIDVAVDAGWLRRKEHGFRGQKWRNHEYEAAWPETQDVEGASLHVDEGAEPGSGPTARGAEPGSGKVRNDVPTNTPLTTPRSSSENARAPEIAFEELVSVFPRRPTSVPKQARTHFEELTPDEQTACLSGARRYAELFERNHSARGEPRERAVQFVPALVTWIINRGWEGLASSEAERLPDFVALEPSQPEFAIIERMRGKPLIVGKSGKATVRTAELQAARSA